MTNDATTVSQDVREYQHRIEALEAELRHTRIVIQNLQTQASTASSSSAHAGEHHPASALKSFPELDKYTVGVGTDPVLFKRFAQLWLHRLDDGYLRRHPADSLLPRVEDLLKFVQSREALEIKVRAFVPTLETHGYTLGCTVVETCMTDQRFILDTLQLLFKEQGLRERVCLHPILDVGRQNSALTDVLRRPAPDGSTHKESIMVWELEPALPADQLAILVQKAQERLLKAYAVVRDFRKMLRRVNTLANELETQAEELSWRGSELNEMAALLQWLRQERFVLMAYEKFDLKPGAQGLELVSDARSRLGLRSVEEPRGLPETAGDWLQGESLLFVGKKLRESNVHRPGKMDVVLVKTLDDAGNPSQVHVITGLFTRSALSEQGGNIPVLRGKLATLLNTERVQQDNYLQRGIVLTFNSMPIEYLFSVDTQTLDSVIRHIMSAEEQQEISAFCEVDDGSYGAFVLTSIPRDRYTSDLHERMASHFLGVFGATYKDSRQIFGTHGNVLVYFFLTGTHKLTPVDEATLNRQIQGLARTWEDGFRTALLNRAGEAGIEEATGLFHRFVGAFPEEYQVGNSPDQAADDVRLLMELEKSGRTQFRICAGEKGYELRMFEQTLTPLTSSLPILSWLGFEVASEVSVQITLSGAEDKQVWLNIFQVTPPGGPEFPLLPQEKTITEALSAIFEGRMENDRLNQLVLIGDVNWRYVDMLRAYINYNRQLSSQSPLDFSRQVCLTHRAASKLLILLFAARFDPALTLEEGQTRASLVESLSDRFKEQLRKVEISSEDKVLRNLYTLIMGTVRTNFYRARHYLSFKFEPSKLIHMIEPRPFREIFVHHPEVEGVHLRGGPIARGGLRWSDRHDDYRIEVLGLMTTQQVKNVVIVPVGSKGGFVLKRRYTDRKLERREADRLYEIFISGLLDVTDNIVDGQIVPPADVVRWDGDDPYLVVAADKGTAHLSNTANKLSLERGFWLGDAFASGGSNGYDHKALAITSRGGWESVKRHFLELGIHPERDVLTVVGIGDMSGDVFGNGLQRSRTLKLLGAFNHMHVFLDPNPDPEVSFNERQRLFDLPGSTWDDYDASLISQGGGIFKRTAKAIALTPEVKAMLGVEAESLSGEEIIHLLMKMDVDLLWNGGIGTYVKASYETHADVGDRINDAVRVDARELRARVVAEGGNLGMTMNARLEYAEKGGKLNTDAVDNSGGVDTSDHEVNLKILFEPLCRKGIMSYEARNTLLHSLSDEVCTLVLFDNFSQNLLISLDERRSRQNLLGFGRLIEFLEQNQGLNRSFERLPDAQTLAERRAQSRGLNRPELSKLLAYTKMYVFRKLMEDPNFKGARVEEAIRAYFPKAVVEQFGQYFPDHPLRKEIAATYYSNRVVDTAGMGFFYNIWEDYSFDVTQVTFGYLLVGELLDAQTLRQQLLALEGSCPTEAIYQALLLLEDILALLTRRMIRRNFDVYSPESVKERLKPDFDRLRAELPEVLAAEIRGECDKRAEHLQSLGLPEGLARQVALYPELVSAADIALLKSESGFDLRACAQLYHRVGEDFGLRRSIRSAQGSAADLTDWWNKSALTLLRARLIDLQYQVCLRLTRNTALASGAGGLSKSLEGYRQDKAGLLERVRAFEKRQGRAQGSSAGVAPLVILSSMLEELAG